MWTKPNRRPPDGVEVAHLLSDPLPTYDEEMWATMADLDSAIGDWYEEQYWKSVDAEIDDWSEPDYDDSPSSYRYDDIYYGDEL